MSDSPNELLLAGPGWQRPLRRVMFALARRPRGLALLRRFAPADQAAFGLLMMAHYDDDAVARGLGFDADAVLARGRELRREREKP